MKWACIVATIRYVVCWYCILIYVLCLYLAFALLIVSPIIMNGFLHFLQLILLSYPLAKEEAHAYTQGGPGAKMARQRCAIYQYKKANERQAATNKKEKHKAQEFRH